MKVHISEVGYYGFHYMSQRTINLPRGTVLQVEDSGHKILRSVGYTPLLVPASIVNEYQLSSAVVWSPT